MSIVNEFVKENSKKFHQMIKCKEIQMLVEDLPLVQTSVSPVEQLIAYKHPIHPLLAYHHPEYN